MSAEDEEPEAVADEEEEKEELQPDGDAEAEGDAEADAEADGEEEEAQAECDTRMFGDQVEAMNQCWWQVNTTSSESPSMVWIVVSDAKHLYRMVELGYNQPNFMDEDGNAIDMPKISESMVVIVSDPQDLPPRHLWDSIIATKLRFVDLKAKPKEVPGASSGKKKAKAAAPLPVHKRWGSPPPKVIVTSYKTIATLGVKGYLRKALRAHDVAYMYYVTSGYHSTKDWQKRMTIFEKLKLQNALQIFAYEHVVPRRKSLVIHEPFVVAGSSFPYQFEKDGFTFNHPVLETKLVAELGAVPDDLEMPDPPPKMEWEDEPKIKRKRKTLWSSVPGKKKRKKGAAAADLEEEGQELDEDERREKHLRMLLGNIVSAETEAEYKARWAEQDNMVMKPLEHHLGSTVEEMQHHRLQLMSARAVQALLDHGDKPVLRNANAAKIGGLGNLNAEMLEYIVDLVPPQDAALGLLMVSPAMPRVVKLKEGVNGKAGRIPKQFFDNRAILDYLGKEKIKLLRILSKQRSWPTWLSILRRNRIYYQYEEDEKAEGHLVLTKYDRANWLHPADHFPDMGLKCKKEDPQNVEARKHYAIVRRQFELYRPYLSPSEPKPTLLPLVWRILEAWEKDLGCKQFVMFAPPASDLSDVTFTHPDERGADNIWRLTIVRRAKTAKTSGGNLVLGAIHKEGAYLMSSTPTFVWQRLKKLNELKCGADIFRAQDFGPCFFCGHSQPIEHKTEKCIEFAMLAGKILEGRRGEVDRPPSE